ncbi:MAG: cytidine deaminase [Candidatus Hydrogenedentes bacterium]|nr:cytidine deaminase [Candidatus Hydrogenedentota bacterium]
MTEFDELLKAVQEATVNYQASEDVHVGSVGAALLTPDGRIFTGACVDCICGIGFCAEHSAIAEMLKHRVTRVVAMVAWDSIGKVLSPCGRCRQFLHEIDDANWDMRVYLGVEQIVTLRELLPYRC